MKTLLKKAYKRAYRRLLWPVLNRLDNIQDEVKKIQAEVEKNRMLIVQPRIREFYETGRRLALADAEFQVFSQWGEDGIIQYLISKVPIENKVFVEFGVEDYRESNTRFLLMNNNWRGLVIDCDEDYVTRIRATELYWRYDLTAICSFITKDNINSLIKGVGIEGDIGLLSIDIDGNDYWIWEAISADVILPRIVIVEYNSLFGKKLTITIPYKENFNRTKAHYSNLYFGASLKALCRLAKQKGYDFVGSNSAGCNAFFVRKDVAANLPELECTTGYVESRSRESRDEKGNLTFVSGANRLKIIENQIVFDIGNNKTARIKDLLI